MEYQYVTQYKLTSSVNSRNKLALCNDLPTLLQSRPNSTRSRARRRRGTVTTEDLSPSSDQNIIKDLATFLSASDSFLSHIEKGLEPMKPVNDEFIISRGSNEVGDFLTINAGIGTTYSIQVEIETYTIKMISPMSGTYSYVLCGTKGTFVGMHDEHDLIGMLVRDLIKHTNGLPQF